MCDFGRRFGPDCVRGRNGLMMLMMSRDHIELRLLVMPSLLCRHSCRHSLSAWWIGNPRPSSQIFPDRPRGPRGGSMRSFGIEIPGLWVTGPQARKKRCPTTSTGAKELGTPKRKQPNNNNKPPPLLPASCRLPRRRFPTTSWLYATPLNLVA